MERLVLLLLTGISSGMITYLAAAGLSIVIAGMDMINFGAGAYYMMGAFLCFQISRSAGFGVALLVVPIAIAVLGLLTECLLRPLYTREKIYQLLLTIGMGYILQDVMVAIWGYRMYTVKLPSMLRGVLWIGQSAFPVYYVFAIIVASAIALALMIMFYKTKIGIIFRAIISDRNMVNVLGINVTLMFTLMFMLAMWLTGLAGALVSPTISVTSTDTLSIFVATMTALRIGGWKSLRGAFGGALLIGIVNAFGAMYLGWYYSIIPTVIMLIVLMVKPKGLFADKE